MASLFNVTDQDLIERIARPFHTFAQHKLAGAGLLVIASVAGIISANSDFGQTYLRLLAARFTVGLGTYELSKPLILWINDGLMGIFFFVVGLEIKRELLAGELANLRKALLPIVAAVGGMAVPALVYMVFNDAGPGARGWGIPMATDIAFALGVLALLPVPIGLKVFLTALAIVDDLGAIIVIAVFYTSDISLVSLAIGAVVLMVLVAANISGVRNPIVYFLLGLIVWVAFLKSGVHATLAAVLMAMTIPARTRIDGVTLTEQMSKLLQDLKDSGLPSQTGLLSTRQHGIVQAMEQLTERATAPLQEIEHALMPFVTFLVLPVFALANAGVVIDFDVLEALQHPVPLGIIAGLVIGKPLGIFIFSWMVIRLGYAELPKDVSFLQLLAVGFLGGIGFTMSLFVAGLALPESGMIDVAKVGVLAGSILSALLGFTLLAWSVNRRPLPPAP